LFFKLKNLILQKKRKNPEISEAPITNVPKDPDGIKAYYM